MVSVSRSVRQDSALISASERKWRSEARRSALPLQDTASKASSPTCSESSSQKELRIGDAHLQLPLPLNCQEPPITSLLLRFPWGKRTVEEPLLLQSYEPRELAYLRWVFDRPPISQSQVNHLLFLAQPLSYFPGKLIREGRSTRARRGQWPTHGCT